MKNNAKTIIFKYRSSSIWIWRRTVSRDKNNQHKLIPHSALMIHEQGCHSFLNFFLGYLYRLFLEHKVCFLDLLTNWKNQHQNLSLFRTILKLWWIKYGVLCVNNILPFPSTTFLIIYHIYGGGSFHFMSPRPPMVTIPDFAEILLKWSFLQQKWTLKISASYHNPLGIYPPLNFEQFPCFKLVIKSIAHFCQLWVKIIFSPKFCSAWKLVPQ